MIRVLVVAKSVAARTRLVGELAGDDQVEIVGQTLAPMRLERFVDASHAHVLVASLHPDDEPLTQELLTLAVDRSGPAVVAVVDEDDPAWTSEALRAGIRAVLPRDASPTELQAAVRAAAAGLVVVPRDDVRDGGRSHETPGASPERSGPTLTRREIEVLGLLAEGLSNKAIAKRLAITERTVKFHVGAIFEKLHVTSRTEAVTAGFRRGLILL
jgi:two-component system, NarL family, response regulator YdfI